MNSEDLKQKVKDKYGEIARGTGEQNQSSCCCQPSDCCSSVDYTVFSESYEKLDGYNPDELLTKYLTCDELDLFRNGTVGIYSITVSGYKQ
jgi:hypothetical protein